MILVEDNYDIESFIKYLRVIEIRRSGKLQPNDELYQIIKNFYDEDIMMWMEVFY